MDFQLTEEQAMLQANARAFIQHEITPLAQERDRRGALSREETISLIKRLMPFGYYNGWLPPEYGGVSLNHKTVGVLHEELSRAWAGLAGTVWMAGGTGGTLAVDASLRPEMAERVRAGESIGAGAISEPNVGSDASGIETTATADGDFWMVNGTNVLTSLPNPAETRRAIQQLEFLVTIEVLPSEIAGWSDVTW